MRRIDGLDTVDVRRETTTPPIASVARHPYRSLGSFRFLLASLVLTSHASGFLSDDVAALSLGNVGVFLFFVVSGFVIFEALDLFYRTSSVRFLANRCLKIFPAYWCAVAFSYLVYDALGREGLRTDPFALIVNASLLLAYLPQGNNLLVISIAWAVVVEFQFYILAALVFAVLRGSSAPRLTLTLAGLATLAAYVYVAMTGSQARFFGAFQFGPYFMLGAALYYHVTRGGPVPLWIGLVSFAFSVHAYVTYHLRAPSLAGDSGVFASTLLFVGGVALMAWLVTQRIGNRAEALDKRLGDVTYAIYLVHPAIIAIAVGLAFTGAQAYLACLVASLMVAVLIHFFVERPVFRFRNALRGARLYD